MVVAGADGRDGLKGPAQHLLLEPSQLGRGVEAELVAEPVAVAGICRQRVTGPAGLSEGGDQQLHGPLPPGFAGGDGLQGGGRLGDPAQPEQQDRPILLGGEPELLEAQRLASGKGRREFGIGRASPQSERPVQQRERGRGRFGGPRLAEQGGEAFGIDGVARDLEDVAGRPGGDDRRGQAKGLA
jgi:hypothetical protein